jgi:uncharacterized membrane protein YfcA
MELALKNHVVMLVILGIVTGVISGALGVGSGIIFIPALVLILGASQKVAQGTSLAVMVAMALMGAIRYHLNPEIKLQMPVILILAVTAVIGANIGSSLAFVLPGAVLRKCFAVFVILVGVRMLFK